MPPRNLAILILAAIVSILCYHNASKSHYGGLLAGAIGEIDNKFVRPVDERELFEGAMEGMVRELDPYSDFITPEELASFQEDLDQKFGGIGIVVEFDDKANRITVMSPLPDTPALAAGMRAGDQILAIDGKSVQGFQVRDAVDMMRGEPGTELTLSVLHMGDEEPVEMTIERAIIPVASVLGDSRNPDGTWDFTVRDHPRLGMIRLATFGEKTAAELRATLTSIEPIVEGVILDLRGNGGGLLKSAVEVCDLFIDEGAIVSIRGRDRADWQDYSAEPSTTVFRNKPLVVLVDGYSASASEITAACLQDHGRAVVVGTRSWGKGTVQNVMPFEGGRSALKLTVATYWRPSGQNIHRHVDATEEDAWGVTPDEGYAVETDDVTMTKIILLRQKYDKVLLDEEPETDSQDSSESLPKAEEEGEENGGSNESAERKLPDITGFEDPQRVRAIEALLELVSESKTKSAA